ncbi:PHP domain-containing protein [Anaeromyxobacter terrae]|uniref:PHP domain-containing protein n=1 Tax=Anaeromyxobacter terrae TaxID=2925406 RepID=UPI001F5ADD0C|nr:PHP domain-containing protein [Anaeromyxobacter sp. SG22]
MKRIVLAAVVLLLAGYAGFGAMSLRERALRRSAAVHADAAREGLRGAYHVHTTASDGRGTLAEVITAVRDAGLDFVVVTDHNVRAPERAEYVDGVLVVPATEVSTPYGHVVALGVPRALTREERDRDPLGAIAALGGQAVLAHPFHPRRPFTGWGRGPWRGFEVVSNDTSWYRVVTDRAAGKVVRAAAALPFDGAGAVLALSEDPSDELARFDSEERAARARGEARVLLCSADAHGYPGYRAAFEAFSMRVPVRRTGDAEADARAVTAALLDGSAACVFDGVAPAGRVRLARPDAGTLALSLGAPPDPRARFTLLRDGRPAGALAPDADGAAFRCGGPCPPGDYRVEARIDGRPWIFTNPLRIE